MRLFIPSLSVGRQGKQGIFTRTLTIDHLQVPSTQTNFPVLVSFTNSTFKTVANGGHVQATNAFTFSSDSAGASLLTWEVERYDATTGEIVAWVKIASVSSVSDTVFYLRYGSTITTDQSDAANVWTNSFVSVFHLKDGTTLSVTDSVGNHNGTNHGVTAATGQIDGGGGFASASSQYFDTASYAGPTAITLSAWVNSTLLNAYNAVVGQNNANTTYCLLMVKSTGKVAWLISNAGVTQDGTGSHTLSASTWYYLTMTYDSSAGLVGYVNASSDATHAANGALPIITVANTIGKDSVNAGRFWDGTLDEVRVASVARAADWVTCEYNNQQTSSTFVALGAET